MKGITNAPQGSGGSGGDWTERTANSDWTDIFDITGNVVTAKKDILIHGTHIMVADLGYPVKVNINAIIPKGMSASSLIEVPFIVSYEDSPAGKTFGGATLQISASKVQIASFFNVYIEQYAPVLNGTTISYTVTRNNTGTVSKSLLKVFTKG